MKPTNYTYRGVPVVELEEHERYDKYLVPLDPDCMLDLSSTFLPLKNPPKDLGCIKDDLFCNDFILSELKNKVIGFLKKHAPGSFVVNRLESKMVADDFQFSVRLISYDRTTGFDRRLSKNVVSASVSRDDIMRAEIDLAILDLEDVILKTRAHNE